MKVKTLTIFLIFLFTNLKAQIRINFPINRAVFQRNLNNEADVSISGSLSRPTAKVEARFTPINGQGVDDGTWHTIQTNANQGYFSGKVKVKGGWYRLEVRGTSGNSVETATVDKMGVGEVFVIAGQSNAQGVEEYGSFGANDDRVNCVNSFSDYNYINNLNTNLNISQLSQEIRIAPNGKTSWCWGELGDKLIQRFNVPILFFNAAYGGTLAINWRESALGQPTSSAIFGRRFPDGFPYNNLRLALNYYASLFGVRSILWHQGETDTFPGVPNRNNYFNDLKTVIERSRIDFGNNVPWVISKVSYTGNLTSQEVLIGQQMVLDIPNFNTFQGPSTDNIQIPRPDVVHFQNTATIRGISQLADAWNNALTNAFFSNYTPIPSQPIADFQQKIVNGCQVNLLINNPYTIHTWNDGNVLNERGTNTGGNYFFALVKDNNNNFRYTPAFNPNAIDSNLPTPQITAATNSICEGQSVDLNVNQSYTKYVWSDGVETSNRRNISQQNVYSVKGVNSIGCVSASSNVFNLRVNPVPQKPRITTNDPLNVCEGAKITLRSSDLVNKNLWSNGLTNANIELTKVGEYKISLVVETQFGCKSSPADTVKASILSSSQKPRITSSDPLIGCEGNKITLKSSDLSNKIAWSNGATGSSIELTRAGDYKISLIVENQAGCKSSPADTVKISIRSSPLKPQVVSNGIFGLRLIVPDSATVNTFKWQLNGQDLTFQNKNIYAKQSGIYNGFTSKTYQLGINQAITCSTKSDNYNHEPDPSLVGIRFYPNPAKNVIYLESKVDLNNTNLDIYQLSGALVETINLNTLNERKTINLSTIPKGNYVFKLSNSEFKESKIILIE